MSLVSYPMGWMANEFSIIRHTRLPGDGSVANTPEDFSVLCPLSPVVCSSSSSGWYLIPLLAVALDRDRASIGVSRWWPVIKQRLAAISPLSYSWTRKVHPDSDVNDATEQLAIALLLYLPRLLRPILLYIMQFFFFLILYLFFYYPHKYFFFYHFAFNCR